MLPHLAITALTLAAFPTSADAQVARTSTAHVQLELVSPAPVVQNGATSYFAIRQRIAPGWHTYWRNPGEAGLPTRLTWTLPPGWHAGDMLWPAPRRTIAAGVMSYVYSDSVLLPVAISAPPPAGAENSADLRVKVEMLVCSDVCIPEHAELKLTLPLSSSPPSLQSTAAREIQAAVESIPKPEPLRALFIRRGNSLELLLSGRAIKGASSAYFYPYEKDAIGYAAPEIVKSTGDGLTLRILAGEIVPRELAGVLELPDRRPLEIRATYGALPESKDPGSLQIIVAALLALAGGLVLNLMPCVFPILSLKAVTLAKHPRDALSARKEGLAIFAGILATFLLLAFAVVGVHSAGNTFGWGFQLQSPWVVLVLALLLFIMGLNLSGVFEVGAWLQGTGSRLTTTQNLAGSFLTGALAVIVATPCTAPLMAPALGWAVIQPPAIAFTIFAALAVGFAQPYLALAFSPQILSMLPKPGPWMLTFKAALAFPLYASAAWLAWVFVRQQGVDALPGLFAAAIALGLACWCWGLIQRGTGGRLAAAVGMIATLAALPFAVLTAQPSDAPQIAAGAVTGQWSERWSPERLAKLTAYHRPVFVDFTAAWCIACEINNHLVLKSDAVREAFRRTGTTLLVADWTNGDPAITQELSRFQRSGVPLYVVYDRSGRSTILPQILTVGAVKQAVDVASRA
jgi:thiol:disulfide interchange protein DsbD